MSPSPQAAAPYLQDLLSERVWSCSSLIFSSTSNIMGPHLKQEYIPQFCWQSWQIKLLALRHQLWPHAEHSACGCITVQQLPDRCRLLPRLETTHQQVPGGIAAASICWLLLTCQSLSQRLQNAVKLTLTSIVNTKKRTYALMSTLYES